MSVADKEGTKPVKQTAAYGAATGDAAIKASPGVYYGYIVTVVTAVGPIDIRDALSAGAGTVIDTIPAGTAAGARQVMHTGIECAAGIFADYGAGATGTIQVLYK
jgi:hypothetical protein